ncbi:hypothetical protein Fmac_005293 [Flemingia macrophylla]|uniref:Uncharacterized protein n=1 Tax=Flemingia macrophylla TaxID=520843 RepID=A0ABD1N7C1_9FABA
MSIFSSVVDSRPTLFGANNARSLHLINFSLVDGFRDFLLKRSYSLGFKRSLVSERMVSGGTKKEREFMEQNRSLDTKRDAIGTTFSVPQLMPSAT